MDKIVFYKGMYANNSIIVSLKLDLFFSIPEKTKKTAQSGDDWTEVNFPAVCVFGIDYWSRCCMIAFT